MSILNVCLWRLWFLWSSSFIMVGYWLSKDWSLYFCEHFFPHEVCSATLFETFGSIGADSGVMWVMRRVNVRFHSFDKCSISETSVFVDFGGSSRLCFDILRDGIKGCTRGEARSYCVIGWGDSIGRSPYEAHKKAASGYCTHDTRYE